MTTNTELKFEIADKEIKFDNLICRAHFKGSHFFTKEALENPSLLLYTSEIYGVTVEKLEEYLSKFEKTDVVALATSYDSEEAEMVIYKISSLTEEEQAELERKYETQRKFEEKNRYQKYFQLKKEFENRHDLEVTNE